MTNVFSLTLPQGFSLDNLDPERVKHLLAALSFFSSANNHRIVEGFYLSQERLIIFWGALLALFVLFIFAFRWLYYLRLKKKPTKSGSALIITLLIVMVISSIGLGVGRLTLSEIKQTARMEESIAAEAVSESGIEHGLLLYRFNHDIQLSEECPAPNTPKYPNRCKESPTETTGTPKKFDMGSGARYELKIWHKAEKIGTDDNNFSNDPKLEKDQTLQLGNFEDVTSLTIKYQVENVRCDKDGNYGQGHPNQGQPNPACIERLKSSTIAHGVEIKVINPIGEPCTDFKDQWFDDKASMFGWSLATYTPKCFANLGKESIIRIKPWDTDIRYTATVDPGLAVKSGTAPTPKIDSGITYIESTGYFGSTKRKLQVQIDRASGTILGTYDFVLYSGEGAITAP